MQTASSRPDCWEMEIKGIVVFQEIMLFGWVALGPRADEWERETNDEREFVGQIGLL